jgi:competence protein ComEA
MKSTTVGSIVAISLVLFIVSALVLKNAASAPGIVITEPPARATAFRPASPQAAPRVSGTPAATAAEPSDARAATAAGSGPASSSAAVSQQVVVHVVGAVKRPGVVRLPAGARNDDAVNAAGGLAPDANEASINLAALAADGSQLYVRTRKEQPSGGAEEPALPQAASAASKQAAGALARKSPGGAGRAASGAKPAKLKSPAEGRVNINTASSEELQRISGIGPAMAEKIIDYREANHGFQSVDDLMQVGGIGAKKLSKFAPFVRLR